MSELIVETVILPIKDTFGFETNAYLLYDKAQPEQVLLVDPADDLERILHTLDKRKLWGIFCTHRHPDHVGALAALRAVSGAPVYAGRLEADAIRDCVLELAKSRGEALDDAPLDVLLDDNDVISFGDIRLKVLLTPGHTAGSICLYDQASEQLIAGDTLFHQATGRTDLPSGSVKDMRASLKRLAALPDQVCVYPGHNALTTIGHERRHGTLPAS